jgi:hypothetical protein
MNAGNNILASHPIKFVTCSILVKQADTLFSLRNQRPAFVCSFWEKRDENLTVHLFLLIIGLAL